MVEVHLRKYIELKIDFIFRGIDFVSFAEKIAILTYVYARTLFDCMHMRKKIVQSK